MELLSRLPAHPNIVPFCAGTRRLKRSSGLVATEVLLLTEFYEGGGLNEALDRLRDQGRSLDEPNLLRLFSQAVEAVAHLHSQTPPIAHRDIKMENLLLQGSLSQVASGHGRLVLCDFGSATTRAKVYEGRREILEEEERIQKTTTLAYRAPEMVDLYQRRCINEKVDIWSLGVLLYVMAFSKFPFDPSSPLAVLSGRYPMPPARVPGLPVPPDYSSRLASLVACCLTVEPADRGNILQVREQLRVCNLGGGDASSQGWARFDDMA
jgi:AP2-associated kinase